MVSAVSRRNAITDMSTDLVEAIAKQVSQVALDRYAEGFADGSEYTSEKMAEGMAASLDTAANAVEAYRLQLEKVQRMLNTLTVFDMENEDVITKGRMLVLETLHYAFSQVMEGEGTTENEEPNVLMYTPAQIIYANSFLSMITLHSARIATENPGAARLLLMDAIEAADEHMLTTENLHLDLNVNKLDPAPPSA